MAIGLTCGTFDYEIHKGHISFLEICNMLCDELYVAVVPDLICSQIKRVPYFPQEIRERNLIGTGLVNGCVAFANGLHNELLAFDFDIYIIGKDQNSNQWTGRMVELLYKLSIPTVSTFEPRIESTSRLLKKIKYQHTAPSGQGD